MATPRKHWFRVEDSIRGQGWDNDELAMAVRLMALLNTQWARNGIRDPDKACRITLSPGALADCAGCQSVVRARSVLRRLSMRSRLTFDESGADTSIYWPKYAEVQELRTPRMPESSPDIARELPSPLPLPQTLPKTQELTASQLAAPEPAAREIDPLERPLRLLGQEPGSLEAKRMWLARELPLIEAEAAQIEPNGKTASQHFRSTLIRYWRQSRLPQRKVDDRAERTRKAAVGALFHKGALE